MSDSGISDVVSILLKNEGDYSLQIVQDRLKKLFDVKQDLEFSIARGANARDFRLVILELGNSIAELKIIEVDLKRLPTIKGEEN